MSPAPQLHASAAPSRSLSAIRYPEGGGPALVGRIKEHGAIVAGGLHPAIKSTYFRVGHMGYTVTRDDWLLRVVESVAVALQQEGHDRDPQMAVQVAREALG